MSYSGTLHGDVAKLQTSMPNMNNVISKSMQIFRQDLIQLQNKKSGIYGRRLIRQ